MQCFGANDGSYVVADVNELVQSIDGLISSKLSGLNPSDESIVSTHLADILTRRAVTACRMSIAAINAGAVNDDDDAADGNTVELSVDSPSADGDRKDGEERSAPRSTGMGATPPRSRKTAALKTVARNVHLIRKLRETTHQLGEEICTVEKPLLAELRDAEQLEEARGGLLPHPPPPRGGQRQKADRQTDGERRGGDVRERPSFCDDGLHADGSVASAARADHTL
jgi:hypothetical protein